MALFEQVEHADNILFYIDDNQIIFTDSTQGDNESLSYLVNKGWSLIYHLFST